MKALYWYQFNGVKIQRLTLPFDVHIENITHVTMMRLQTHAQHPAGPAPTISSEVKYKNSPKRNQRPQSPMNQSRLGLDSNTDDLIQHSQQLHMHPQYITLVIVFMIELKNMSSQCYKGTVCTLFARLDCPKQKHHFRFWS